MLACAICDAVIPARTKIEKSTAKPCRPMRDVTPIRMLQHEILRNSNHRYAPRSDGGNECEQVLQLKLLGNDGEISEDLQNRSFGSDRVIHEIWLTFGATELVELFPMEIIAIALVRPGS